MRLNKLAAMRYSRLILFAALVMLAFAGPAMQAQTPAPDTVAKEPLLTPELISKILNLMDLKGVDLETPARISAPLGLSANGEKSCRQVSARSDSNGDLRSVTVIKDNDLDIIFSRRNETILVAFRAHRDGTLLNALKIDMKTGQTTVRTPVEAQADFADECTYWKQHLDDFLKQK